MQTITLYRYTRPDGGITTSTIKPDSECTEIYRLVAGDGLVLSNGETTARCVDTDNPGEWYEVEENSEQDLENNPASDKKPLGERVATLEEENKMLLQCILEMSEIVYA